MRIWHVATVQQLRWAFGIWAMAENFSSRPEMDRSGRKVSATPKEGLPSNCKIFAWLLSAINRALAHRDDQRFDSATTPRRLRHSALSKIGQARATPRRLRDDSATTPRFRLAKHRSGADPRVSLARHHHTRESTLPIKNRSVWTIRCFKLTLLI